MGAGAAGLFCASVAGARGRRVLVLDHNDEIGAKILISGGGRCNFTNVDAGRADRYVSANPHFARSALSRFTPADFCARVEARGVRFYEKTLGQLFCEGASSARKIVEMLRDECRLSGVEIRTGVRVDDVRRDTSFHVNTSEGTFEGAALVLATGGLSIPKLGASDLAYRIAAQFGLGVQTPRPGLVPLTFGEDDLTWMRALSGASTEIVATCGGVSFREAALFTHRGLSGPAILQASSYWRAGEAIEIDWAPAHAQDFLVAEKRARPKAHLKAAFAAFAPERLAAALAASFTDAALGDVRDQVLLDIAAKVKAQRLTPIGTEGFAKAEVTVGGIDTASLAQRTMQANAVPGLFVIGEAVDVTGWLGGYNFQWAWSSGWAAGQAL